MRPNETEYKIYQVNAFTKPYSKATQLVVQLKEWLPDELLLKIAKENAVKQHILLNIKLFSSALVYT